MDQLRKQVNQCISRVVELGGPNRVYLVDCPKQIDYTKLDRIPDYYRIYVCLSGRSEVKVPVKEGMKTVLFETGDILLVSPGSWIFGMHNQLDGAFSNLGIALKPEGIVLSEINEESWPHSIYELLYPLSMDLANHKGLVDLIQLIVESDLTHVEKVVKELMLHFFILLKNVLDVPYLEERLPVKLLNILRMQELMHYMQNHYKASLSRSSLSEMFGVSESFLASYLKREHQTTFRDYLLNLRMAAGSRLLVTTEQTVGEISGRVGYSYLESFVFAFEKHFNCSPMQFRHLFWGASDENEYEGVKLLPFCGVNEVQKWDIVPTGKKFGIPCLNQFKEVVELFRVDRQHGHRIAGKVAAQEFFNFTGRLHEIVIVKNLKGDCLGGFQVRKGFTGLIFK